MKKAFVLSCALLAAGPAYAKEAKNPWLAAGLTASAPLVYGVAYYADPSVGATKPGNLIGLSLGSATLGAGHAYAGDWQRGAAVAAGGLGIAGLGMGGTLLAASTAQGQGALGPLIVGFGLTAIALTGYYGWSIYDAFQTAVRVNEK